MRAEISRAQPDIVHANSIRAGIAATAASIGTKLPIFWHLQDELPVHPFSTAIRLLALFSGRTHLIAASQATGDGFRGRLKRLFAKRVPLRVVHNAIEPQKFAFDPANRRKIREEFGLSDDRFVFGIVGQITERKGQLELIKTYAKIRERMPASTLLIVGAPMFNKDYVYHEQLEEIVRRTKLENHVRFLGLRKDVAAVMQSLDALVVNSRSEALVVVAIEAMACGTPVIATSVGGTAEMIEHGKNGWLISYGDERELSEAITAMSRKPELRRTFAANSEKIVASLLNADVFIKNLEEFFAQSARPQTKIAGGLVIAER